MLLFRITLAITIMNKTSIEAIEMAIDSFKKSTAESKWKNYQHGEVCLK